MFATFVLEKDPEQWHDLPAMLENWVRSAGGLAAVALLIYFLARWVRRAPSSATRFTAVERGLFRLAILGIVVGYGGYFALKAPDILRWFDFRMGGAAVTGEAPVGPTALQRSAWLLGAASALIAVTFPFLADLFRLRWRRIWAMARLSFKEAIRRRVLWVFSALILVFLFASWFLNPKPEDQLRNYVTVIYWAMTPLLLFTSGLLAAFSIPTDIRSNTIHTIVTKPVERFEIVLGRFLGFTMLMTIVLAVMTGAGLLYVFREIDPDAQFESMRARVPVYGELGFVPQGDNVGREWEYRRYIAGGRNSKYRAIWTFNHLPAELSDPKRGKTVPCEFTFDVFRTLSLKAEEGKGVFCSFEFRSSRWDPKLKPEYDRDLESERKKASATPETIAASLAEKYGVYEIPSKVVVDYITQKIEIPSALFRSAQAPTGEKAGAAGAVGAPALQVWVKCESGGQYLGMAKRDFYILDAERPFAWNFVKGAIGLWLRVCLVIALCVACSTYLSGIIAGLTVLFLCIAGFFQDYVRTLADGTSVGGGPMESVVRLLTHEALVSPLEPTPTKNLAQGTDAAYRWVLRRFLDIIPDIDRYDWTTYVAEGFNISTTNIVLLDSVMLLGYLFPWAILAYYLMKTREIATY
jgi:hypothetical protein